MSDLDSSVPRTHLVALTLARALDRELSNTTEICLSGLISSSELATEVRPFPFFFVYPRNHSLPLLFIVKPVAHTSRNADRWRPETSQHPAEPTATRQPTPTRTPRARLQLPGRRRLRRPRLASLPKMAPRRAERPRPLDRHTRRRRRVHDPPLPQALAQHAPRLFLANAQQQ